MNEEDVLKPDETAKPEYAPPRLRRLGSIADLTKGTGTLMMVQPQPGPTINNYSDKDGEWVGEALKRGW